MDNRVLDYNPAKGLRIPQDAPIQTRRALTRQERKWVLNTPHRAQTAAMLMMLAGLRRGEMTALLWGDIDLKRKTINVYRAYDFKNKRMKETKTASGMRTVSYRINW
jgi:integrase